MRRGAQDWGTQLPFSNSYPSTLLLVCLLPPSRPNLDVTLDEPRATLLKASFHGTDLPFTLMFESLS